jgi:hypothetical protein
MAGYLLVYVDSATTDSFSNFSVLPMGWNSLLHLRGCDSKVIPALDLCDYHSGTYRMSQPSWSYIVESSRSMHEVGEKRFMWQIEDNVHFGSVSHHRYIGPRGFSPRRHCPERSWDSLSRLGDRCKLHLCHGPLYNRQSPTARESWQKFQRDITMQYQLVNCR